MADSNQAPQMPGETPKIAKKPTPSTMDQKPGNKRTCTFAIFFTFLTALIGLLMGLYATYLGKQLALTTHHQANTLTQLTQKQEDTDKSMIATNQISDTQSQLQKELHSLTQQYQAGLQQQINRPNDWVLLKARYYLELAQINSHWSDDQSTSIALLQQADTLLKTVADQRIFPVREEITRVITQLQALPQNDIVNLLSQIQAIQALVSNSPLQEPSALGESNDSPKTNPSWKEGLQLSLKRLEKLVIVRRDDDDRQVLFSPLHQALVRDLVGMNLQEARWAILQNNNSIYQMALKQALETITRNFAKDSSEFQSITAQLKTLTQVNLGQDRPQIESPLILLNDVIEANYKTFPAPLNQKEKT